MTDRLEITDVGRGTRRIVEVVGDRCVLGMQGTELQLDGSLAAPLLSFVRTDRGYRVEPGRPGGTVTVNGEALFCKDLVVGDVVETDGARLRWLGDGAAARASAPMVRPAPQGRAVPRGPAAAAQPIAAGKGRSRRRRQRQWGPIAAIFGLVVLGIVLVLVSLSRSDWPRTPQHYVDLARSQAASNRREQALATLDFALQDATGATRAAALQLQAEIRQAMAESADAPAVQSARQELDRLHEFERRYLQPSPTRPPARELMRALELWSQRHELVCRRHPDGGQHLQAVAQLRQRYAGLAALDTPDEPADVVFAASARLRFVWRDYRGALALLDGYLQRHPDDPVVSRERERLLRDGEAWLLDRLQRIDRLLESGDRDRAAQDLAELERHSVVPAWAPLVQGTRQRIDALRR